MNRSYYSDSINNFLHTNENDIIGTLSKNNEFSLEQTQLKAWAEQIIV